MRLTLRLTHGASPEPPKAACAELLRIANLLGVVAEIKINGLWEVFAIPGEDLSAVEQRLASAMRTTRDFVLPPGSTSKVVHGMRTWIRHADGAEKIGPLCRIDASGAVSPIKTDINCPECLAAKR